MFTSLQPASSRAQHRRALRCVASGPSRADSVSCPTHHTCGAESEHLQRMNRGRSALSAAGLLARRRKQRSSDQRGGRDSAQLGVIPRSRGRAAPRRRRRARRPISDHLTRSSWREVTVLLRHAANRLPVELRLVDFGERVLVHLEQRDLPAQPAAVPVRARDGFGCALQWVCCACGPGREAAARTSPTCGAP